ncbi:lipase [Sphaerisporangium sp. NPDC051011]|uniref:alpha/beta hydrolase family protein n=1 Tax=Sphaerisporangium sp. NPDC051011 TaxID=3155792 RepID=UPI00340DC1CF
MRRRTLLAATMAVPVTLLGARPAQAAAPRLDPRTGVLLDTRAQALTARQALAGASGPALKSATVAGPTRLRLPAPTGPHRIGTVSLHLVDRSRPDPWVPSVPVRELMVQVWYPARDVRHHPRAPWVSPALAALLAPPGSGLELPTAHGHTGAPALPGRRPVVLYSPGFGVERTAATALVEELVSHGYVVVTIDHTHDSPLVEFPDGRVALNAVPPPTDDPADEERLITKAFAARVADTRFVLEAVTVLASGGNPHEGRRPLPSGLRNAFDLRRVGMLGHSLGGATAAEMMYLDRRLVAGGNVDGTALGRVLEDPGGGLNRPFLLLSSDGHGRDTDESWARLWAGLRGPRHELQLLRSGHMSFTDYQVLLPQAGVPAADLEPGFGTIDGERSVRVQLVYQLAFVDRYLRRHREPLLDGPSARYPEMRFLP